MREVLEENFAQIDASDAVETGPDTSGIPLVSLHREENGQSSGCKWQWTR